MRTSLDNVEKKESARKNSNFFSIISFWYALKLFNEGRKRDLSEDDLTKPLDAHKSEILGERIAMIWSKEYDKALAKKKRPSMSKVIFKTFYRDIIIYGIILVIMELCVRLMQPVFIGLFIRYFNSENRISKEPTRSPMYFARIIYFFSADQGPITKNEAYFFAAGITLCSLIVVMVIHPYMMEVLHIGMKVRVACCSLIYRKALRIKLTALGGQTVGNVVNLMSNDVNRFDMAPIFVHYLWIAPLQLIFVFLFLYRLVDIAAFIGILAILVFIPLQMFFGARTAYLRNLAGSRTDERVRQMNEIIQSMQVIKMYAWENAFFALISALRRKELNVLIQTSYIRGTIMSFIMFTTRLGVFLTVMSYVLEDHLITAENVFVISSFYQVLRQTMTVFFPQGVAMVAESSVSIKRIELNAY
ncbi:hypothetical protein JTB14_015002 [Gonioctena quinquepunctata]|nr:hypothetical protein JTB14_015002 [Gonioctena quinquepunctata]